MVRARHVVCVVGNGLDLDAIDAVVREVAGPGFELDRAESQQAPDPRMRTAFEYSMDRVKPTFTAADWAGIDAHDTVVYLLSPPIDPNSALELAQRTLVVTAALLRAGATAAKGESSGIAHGREHWLALASRAELAREEGAEFDLADALQQAWVRRPISDGGLFYTCGMHLLGEPDIEFELDPAADDDVLSWLEVFVLYLLVERPSIKAGHTFRPAEAFPRRRLQATLCTRYEDDDFFFNPHGYWRLLRPDDGNSP
jgi:Domain of unknown function (DUF4261)